MEKNYTGLIPENVEGNEITAESSAKFPKRGDACDFYKLVKERLLQVNKWQELMGKVSAGFKLTDNRGRPVNRAANTGDHFRIDIPGPGSEAGEGFDWAYVENIQEINDDFVDSIAMIVRPAADPQTENKDTAHFFSKKSTSTFVVTREGNSVTASVYDRNITANDETKQLLDKARNAIAGLSAKYGFSRLQWKALTEALIKTEQ